MIALYLTIGLLVGTASGFFGIGGAVFIIPLLTGFAGFSQPMAQGTAMATLLLPIGALAAWKYWQNGHVDLNAALWIAGAFVIGGWLGASLTQIINPDNLRKAFGVLLIAIGIRTIWK